MCLILFSSQLFAELLLMPPAYQATYEITRGGKPTAKQVTQFSNNLNGFQLKDQTTGTHGLASITGFTRTEITDFSISNNTISEIKHLMKQKVAFSKKSFQFEKQNNTITGTDKKQFTLTTASNPISAHLLPIWLSSMVCSGQTQLEIPVLKSKRIKNYKFKVFNENQQYFRVEREYPKDKKRSTKIWLDKNQNCFPTKTTHQENDDPIIKTKLKQVEFL